MKYILPILISLTCLVTGFLFGSYQAKQDTLRQIHTTQLIWFTNIDRAIASEKHDKALSLTRGAVDGILWALSTAEAHPDFVLANALPFGASDHIEAMLPDIITSTQDYYLPIEGALHEETRLYLSTLNK